jgi:alpha-L-fucosidase
MFHKLKKAIRSAPPVSEGKPAAASSQWDAQYGPAQAVDGDPATFWSLEKDAKTGWLEVDLGQDTSVSRVVIQEGAEAPRTPLVTKFAVEAMQADGTWKAVVEGEGIGNEKELLFEPVTARKFRLHILDAATSAAGSAAVIEEFQLFVK